MKLRLLGALGAGLFTFGIVASANAALVSKLGGQVVYDTDLDITWLADTNLAASTTFGVAGINANGTMNWGTANSWITAMNADGGTGYLGFNDWRLPTTLIPDSSCTNADGSPNTASKEYDCTGSEMGHLFYNEFNATRMTSVLTTGDPTELAKFTNVQSSFYWSGTQFDVSRAWDFGFHNGRQVSNNKVFDLYVWAVRSGDTSAVPVPAAVWLFGSGLVGLLGIAKRKH